MRADLNPWEHLNYFRPELLDRTLARSGFLPLEPLIAVDVGVRPRLKGIRRIGNCLKSMQRTARYAVSQAPRGVARVGTKQG